MKTIKTYKIFESIEYLPKGKNGKPIYPYEKLINIFVWFVGIFEEQMFKEGWFLSLSNSYENTEYWDVSKCDDEMVIVIKPFLYPKREECVNGILTLEQAEKEAKKYGFLIDNHIVYDFDKKIFKKYQHLAIGNELGLL